MQSSPMKSLYIFIHVQLYPAILCILYLNNHSLNEPSFQLRRLNQPI